MMRGGGDFPAFAGSQIDPFFTLKYAESVCGKLATLSGDSKWLTSEAMRLDARMERLFSECVMVGAKTFLLDNPRLDGRGFDKEETFYKNGFTNDIARYKIGGWDLSKGDGNHLETMEKASRS